jgi:adenylate cyclase
MRFNFIKSLLNNGNILIVVFLVSFHLSVYCQDSKSIDSLEQIYVTGNYAEKDQLEILEILSRNHQNTEKRLAFCEELIKNAKSLDSVSYLFGGYIEKANTLQKKGDLSLALENYLIAAEIATVENNILFLGKAYGSLAGVYAIMGNSKTSIRYFKKSLTIFEAENDSMRYAITLENMGDLYLDQKMPDSALIYFHLSEPIFSALKFQLGLAYNLGNTGVAYLQQNRNDLAETYINQALEILFELEDYSPICIYLIHMADIYVDKGDLIKATDFAKRSLSLSTKIGLKQQVSEASLKLSEIHELADNKAESLYFYKQHIAYRDSVVNIEKVQQISNMRTNFEVSQKQTEVDLLNQQKANQKVLIFGLIAILAMTGFYYSTITKAKRRSDDLLLNILPSGTAEELKESGKVKAKKFDSITVMFTDFEAFTKYSQKLSPEVLVQSVDYYFSKFDEIIDEYGLEKIKTIGDAYMCAGGLPLETKDHPEKIINAAFEISKFIHASKDSNLGELAHFNIRIGINTGPVVAGVVGSKKFAYDIWGDTVNVASRMESNSKEGKINISHNTYLLIKDNYECEYRGEIDVKNKGMMKMYYVNGRKDPSPLKVNYHNRQLKITKNQNISV